MGTKIENLADPEVFRRGYEHIRAKDPVLGRILDDHGVLRFEAEGDLFEALVESILSQQLGGAAANSIIRKVRALYPGGRLEARSVYRTPRRQLRASGVSSQKITYLKDLSKRVSQGEIDLESLRTMEDEKIMGLLDQVKGIGPWTVQMLLIFTLGRPDVFPMDDLGVKQGLRKVYSLRELPKKDEMKRLAENWRPYRTVASLYLWRQKDSEQRKG